jgi:hypothetical protein
MNHSIFAPKWASALLAVAVVLLLAPCQSLLAHDAGAADAAPHDATISANDAKRLARRYLGDLGYSMRIGPGGARILSVSLDEGRWAVRVALSNGGSVQTHALTFYVRINDGVIEEPEDAPPQFAAR